MIIRFIGLFSLILLVAACARGVHQVDFDKPPEEDKHFILIGEPVPPLKTLTSGREALNNLVKLGRRADSKVETVALNDDVPREIEMAVLRALKEKEGELETAYLFQKAGQGMNEVLSEGVTENDVLINTRILEWDAVRHPKSRERYNLFLKAETKLMDRKGARVLKKYTCNERKDYTSYKDAPGRYQLMKDDMKLLKSLMNELASKCRQSTVAHF